MYASALVFVLAIPLILMINMPAYGYTSGNPIWYWISFGICVAYTVGCLLWYLILARRRSFAKHGQLWHD
jgi:ESS family glutamate:Na+ symporter